MPASVEMVKIILGPEAASKISKVPLSSDTISHRISDMSCDIELSMRENLFLVRTFLFRLMSLLTYLVWCSTHCLYFFILLLHVHICLSYLATSLTKSFLLSVCIRFHKYLNSETFVALNWCKLLYFQRLAVQCWIPIQLLK
jgi:hypothetical protein